MTIASFHRQVYLGGGQSLLEKLDVLRNSDSLRSLLKESEDRAFWHWTVWA